MRLTYPIFLRCVAALLCGLWMGAGAVHAATIEVNSATDDGVGCTLRKALVNANLGSGFYGDCTAGTVGADSIVFSDALDSQVIKLASALPAITDSLSIMGRGPSATIIDGDAKWHIFDFSPPLVGRTLALQDMTVRNGVADLTSGFTNAGALYVAAGMSATVTGVVFSGNEAKSSGGAIENRGTLAVVGSSFTNNKAAGQGGAIRNIGQLSISGSTFNTNTAERGGAIWISHPTAQVPISGTTFGTNKASVTAPALGFVAYGGALMNAAESGALLQLSSNTYNPDNGAGGNGDVLWEGNPIVTPQPTSAVNLRSAAPQSIAVTSPYVTPTGSVTVYSGYDPVCSLISLSSGTATCAPTTLAAGLHTLSAYYTGDSNHGSNFSADYVQIVNGYINAADPNHASLLISGPLDAVPVVDSVSYPALDSFQQRTVRVPLLAGAQQDGLKSFAVSTRTAGGSTLLSGTVLMLRDTVLPNWEEKPANDTSLGLAGKISYKLSETVRSGRIVFTRTAGTADNTVRTCELQGMALTSGSHEITLDQSLSGCTAAVNLVDGAVYSLSFVATDEAGNNSVATVVTGVTYDATPPQWSGLSPVANGFLTATAGVGFSLSENVASATITFTRTGGTADNAAPHTCVLQGTALSTGGARTVGRNAQANGCATSVALVEGAIYTLSFVAVDAAGNTSVPTSTTGVMLDTGVPVASLNLPATATTRSIGIDGSVFSANDGASGVDPNGYCLQENDSVMACVWSARPAQYTFSSDGNKVLYGYVRDRAGNVSALVQGSVLVDSAPPPAAVLTTTPAFANGASVSLEVQGEVGSQIWINGINTGQTIGATGKTTVAINTSGVAEGQSQTFQITLRDGAGNESSALSLTLTKDSTVPVWSALSPAQGAYLNAMGQFGYTLSEAVATASITLTQTGGAPDGASPHTCVLQGTSLAAGAHNVAWVANANGCASTLALVDGAVYTVTYAATDAADNASIPTAATGVQVDTIKPVASLTVPAAIKTLDLTIDASVFSGSDGGSGVDPNGYCLQESNAVGDCDWKARATQYTFATEGAKVLSAFVRDVAGNVSDAVSQNVAVDLTVPSAATLTTTPAFATGASSSVEVHGEPGTQIWVNGVNSGLTVGVGGKTLLVIDTTGVPEGQSETYLITLRDGAGNESAALSLTLAKDSLSPSWSDLAPTSGGYLNAAGLIGFTLSESVAQATITFTRTGGAMDPTPSHVCTLQGASLTVGAHAVSRNADANGCTTNVLLVDDAIYSMVFNAVDAAGNVPGTAQLTGVVFDAVSPGLAPTNIVVNNTGAAHTVALTFNEALNPLAAVRTTEWALRNVDGQVYQIASAVLSNSDRTVTLSLPTANLLQPATFIATLDALAGVRVLPSALITDLAGNPYAAGEITEAGATHVLDTIAPAVPVVTAPVATSGVGGTLTVAGTAEPGALIIVTEAAGVLGRSVAIAGTYSVSLTGLTTGLHNFQVVAKDAAGNTSTAQTLSYTVLAPPIDPTPPPVVNGPVTVGAGQTAVVTGPAQVTAGPGSTVSFTTQSVGATLIIPPSTGGAAVVVNVVLGGQTIAVSGSGASTLVLEVITLVGADGVPRLVLAIKPTQTGSAQLSMSAEVPPGTVVAVLPIGSGSLPLTATGGGTTSLSFVVNSQGGQLTSTWGVYVGSGVVRVPVRGAMQVRSVSQESPDFELFAGERATIDAQGVLRAATLGTAAADGLGDPISLDSVDGLTALSGIPRLNGVPARIGGSVALDALIVQELRSLGVNGTGQGSHGIFSLTLGGLPMDVLPIEVLIVPGRADGILLSDNGLVEVTRKGLVTRLAPAAKDLQAFGKAVQQAGASAQLQPTGNVQLRVAEMTWVVRPQWIPVHTNLAPGFSAQGEHLVYTNDQGQSQVLSPAFNDLDLLRGTLQALLSPQAALTLDFDHRVRLRAPGLDLQLLPQYELITVPAERQGLAWWIDGATVYIAYPDGRAQAFKVAP